MLYAPPHWFAKLPTLGRTHLSRSCGAEPSLGDRWDRIVLIFHTVHGRWALAGLQPAQHLLLSSLGDEMRGGGHPLGSGSHRRRWKEQTHRCRAEEVLQRRREPGVL